MYSHYKKIPTLVLGYNRPNKLQKVIERLIELDIKNIFIVIDGPKNNSDIEKNLKIKDIISSIPKKVNLKKIIRSRNLGCQKSVSEAISWFFKINKFGIILEDDCIPNKNFYLLCLYANKKYAINKKIFGISGTNFIPSFFKFFQKKNTYYVSKYLHVWGWATWSDRWNEFDLKKYLNIQDHEKNNFFIFEYFMWNNIFNLCKNSKINSWAYPLQACLFSNKFKVIVSSNRLIDNIGFGKDSSNTKNSYLFYNTIHKSYSLKNFKDWFLVKKFYFDFFEYIFHYKGFNFIFNKLVNKKINSSDA